MAAPGRSIEQLRQAQDVDAIPTLAWSARPDGSAEFLDRRWLDYTGLSAEEASDWGWTAAVISSVGAHAVVGKPGLDNPSILVYASTKGALETLVKNWAAILGPRGIRVNAVAPGVIDTDMSNFTKTEVGREATLGMQALKRIGKPEDVADVIAFLATDKARWITGASVPVDGGSKL